jgi:uncharacterized protein (TIGR03086 family)
MNAVTQLERAHTMTAALIDGVGEEHWLLPTPCPDWNVRALANHMVGGYRLFTSAIKQTDPPGHFEQDWLGNNPHAAYREAAAAVLTAWEVPGAMDRPLSISVGVVPGHLGALIHLTEVIVHGIDLAVSTGQEYRVNQESAQHLLNTMQEPGMMDPFRIPGVFGPEQPAPAEAPAHHRLMAFLGRDIGSPGNHHRPAPEVSQPV